MATHRITAPAFSEWPQPSLNGCRGRSSSVLPTSPHYTYSATLGQRDILLLEESLAQRMPAVLQSKPWQGPKLPQFHGSFPQSLGSWNVTCKCHGVLLLCRSLRSDKTVALAQLSCKSNSPSHDTATPHVPFCTPRRGAAGTPTCTPRSTEPLEHVTFSSSEVECFQARLRESQDSHYALWLETFHPRASASTHDGVLEVILKRPTPPTQCKMPSNPTCGRVLTSHDCIREMEEKAEKKKRQEEEKEERRKERERKKREREMAQASKKSGKDNFNVITVAIMIELTKMHFCYL